jgi:flagellar hook-basal body complex protein FliE
MLEVLVTPSQSGFKKCRLSQTKDEDEEDEGKREAFATAFKEEFKKINWNEKKASKNNRKLLTNRANVQKMLTLLNLGEIDQHVTSLHASERHLAMR